MKVLWICNLILPEVASDMGLGTIPKEGWVKGLLDALMGLKVKNQNANEGKDKEENSIDLQLSFAFPVGRDVLDKLVGESSKKDFHKGTVVLKDYQNTSAEYYAFYEDTVNEYLYDSIYEQTFRDIFDEAKPDIVHCFGTEFPHTLAAARAWGKPDRLLVGIQGPCTVYAERYFAHLPESVVNRHSFRDMLKKDSIKEQQSKFEKRGENERSAVALAGHIAGRTDFDKELATKWNSQANYHYAGETLRKDFYSGEWTNKNSEKHRIFVSQADYPIKGFHYLLIAVGELLRETRGDQTHIEQIDLERKNVVQELSNIEIYVAGQSIVGFSSLKSKIKISSYGLYLRQLMVEYGLKDKIHFLGRLSAAEMKEQYLKADTYVCCSECENSPNSLGEAMMLKTPIVTARVGGIPTVFDVENDGFSYQNEPGDSLEQVVAALKDALIERWGADESEVNTKRENAYAHALRNHDPEKNASDMYKIYTEIFNS